MTAAARARLEGAAVGLARGQQRHPVHELEAHGPGGGREPRCVGRRGERREGIGCRGGIRARCDHRRALAPLGGRAPARRSASPNPWHRPHRPLDLAERHLHAARDDHVVGPAPDAQGAVVRELAEVARAIPARAVGVGREGRRRCARDRRGSRRRASAPTARRRRRRCAARRRRGAPVVDASAGRLARSVGAGDAHAERVGRQDQARRRGLPAQQDAVERVQGVGHLAVGPRRFDEPGELHRHERRVPREPPVEPSGCLGERDRVEVLALEHHRLRARDDRPDEHLRTRDVVRGQGEQPLPGTAERRLRRRGARAQRLGREQHALRGIRRPARLDHEGDAIVDDPGRLPRRSSALRAPPPATRPARPRGPPATPA